MKALFFLLLMSLSFTRGLAQFKEELVAIKAGNDSLRGSLFVPEGVGRFPLFVLEAGSGPTDRNGNNPLGVSANSYRLLAIELAKQHIGTLLFDKRGIAASGKAPIRENNLLFDDYVNDYLAWVSTAAADKRVSRIVAAGHSEGSLIAMLAAARTKVAGYISIAGPAKSIDAVIKDQLAKYPEGFRKQADSLFDLLRAGKKIDSVPPNLLMLFRPSIQPYLKSWMRYTPCDEIKKLTVPVLILQGSTDLQVNEAEGRALAACKPGATFELITGMNHVLKNSSTDQKENAATYKNPALPLNSELVKAIATFIKNINR